MNKTLPTQSESTIRGQITLEDVKKMSNQKLRIAVAEAHGIFVCPFCFHEIDPEVCHCGSEIKKHNPYHDGHSPVPMGCTCGYNEAEKMKAVEPNCPDYPHDLNAVHSVVLKLNSEQRHAYAVILANFFWPMGWKDWHDTLSVSEATARQRCEALVLTLSERGENFICPQISNPDEAGRVSRDKKDYFPFTPKNWPT